MDFHRLRQHVIRNIKGVQKLVFATHMGCTPNSPVGWAIGFAQPKKMVVQIPKRVLMTILLLTSII